MGDDWLNNIKYKLKKNPTIYQKLIDYISPVKNDRRKDYRIMHKYLKGKTHVILNLGSGPFKLEDGIVNVDIEKYGSVAIVADIQKLPFKDGTVDGVISIAVLEHVKDPLAMIQEARRVIKKGGYIYSVIPFMQGYHASPSDYQRYTISGIENLHEGFQKVDAGTFGGPTSGFLWILQEWLSIALSFGSQRLYRIWFFLFTITLWPLKYADLILVRFPAAGNIASSFYYLGYKK